MPRPKTLIIRLIILLCCLLLVFNIYKYNGTPSKYSGITQFFISKISNSTLKQSTTAASDPSPQQQQKIFISFVVCKTRFNEALNVVKSALLFTRTPLHFIIFTDNVLRLQFNNTLSDWKTIDNAAFEFELHNISFPKEHEEDWMNLFSKCAAQRLFIPSLLPQIDALIYVDIDVLFLGPVDDLWGHFAKFNSSQISAMAVEDENPNVSWYPRFAKHPFYGKYGLNSGVMLMNLTRMREFGWVDYVTPIMLKYKLYIPWGDQDIINVIFHYHGPRVLELSCAYNYRSEQCAYGAACPPATSRGVRLLHGSRGVFHSGKQPAFQAMYRAIDEHTLGRDSLSELVSRMGRYLDEPPATNCGALKETFLKAVQPPPPAPAVAAPTDNSLR